jgi:hypothetical protein
MNIIREEWIFYLRKIIDPLIDALSSSNLKNIWKLDSNIAYFEAFARSFSGIAPWISLNNNDLENKLRNEYLSKIIICFDNIFNPDNPDFIDITNIKQAVVESALIAQAFIRATILWTLNYEVIQPGLSNRETTFISDITKNRIINSFISLRKFFVVSNNWILFSAMIEAFFFKFNLYKP